jgi:hypothetical protein
MVPPIIPLHILLITPLASQSRLFGMQFFCIAENLFTLIHVAVKVLPVTTGFSSTPTMVCRSQTSVTMFFWAAVELQLG